LPYDYENRLLPALATWAAVGLPGFEVTVPGLWASTAASAAWVDRRVQRERL